MIQRSFWAYGGDPRDIEARTIPTVIPVYQKENGRIGMIRWRGDDGRGNETLRLDGRGFLYHLQEIGCEIRELFSGQLCPVSMRVKYGILENGEFAYI